VSLSFLPPQVSQVLSRHAVKRDLTRGDQDADVPVPMAVKPISQAVYQVGWKLILRVVGEHEQVTILEVQHLQVLRDIFTHNLIPLRWRENAKRMPRGGAKGGRDDLLENSQQIGLRSQPRG